MAWEKLISTNATVYDTVGLIIKTINRYATDPAVQQITQHISKTSPHDFLRGLFDFVCKNVSYEKDPDGHERITTPMRLLRDGKGDCKKMSVFISSVLKCKGINNYLRIVSYDGKSFAHIYPIVPTGNSYITMDPVNDEKYNREVDHVKSETYNLNGKKMNLSILGRTNQSSQFPALSFKSAVAGVAALDDDLSEMGCNRCPANNYNADAMGWKNDYFSYTTQEAAGHAAMIVSFALFRNAFLGLLYLGKLLRNTKLKLNFADRLAKGWNKDKNHVRKIWWKLGGTASAAALKNAITKGTGIGLSGPGTAPGHGCDYPIDLVTPYLQARREGDAGISGMGSAAATISAAIATAMPVILKIKAELQKMGINVDDEPPVPDNTPPPADPPPPPPPPPGETTQGVTGFIFAASISESLPLYISVPMILFVGWHYNKEKIKNFFA